jgi:hypothetical protein
MKTAVAGTDDQGHIVYNCGLIEFARHHDFQPRASIRPPVPAVAALTNAMPRIVWSAATNEASASPVTSPRSGRSNGRAAMRRPQPPECNLPTGTGGAARRWRPHHRARRSSVNGNQRTDSGSFAGSSIYSSPHSIGFISSGLLA